MPNEPPTAKRMVARLRRSGDPIAADYDRAAWVAETAVGVAREIGAYPLLSSGDVNIYSLFVERALRLVRRDGIIGLLVPSGIAGDKGAAEFFRSISTTGRLAALLDFENRRTTRDLEPFFPDVDSRFKFCAFVAGGPARIFEHADCAFFKQDAAAAETEALPLAPEDFATVNPNTGTAPVFRSRRDAEITLGIYRRLPVLVDRRGEQPASVWPVRYFTMFHMTNDLGEFRTAAELERLGAYRVTGQRWEMGDQRWLPLYEGKMVQAYDQRAASVLVNPENLNRPGQPEPATDDAARRSFMVADAAILGQCFRRSLARPLISTRRLQGRDLTDKRSDYDRRFRSDQRDSQQPTVLLPDDTACTAQYQSCAALLLANLCSLALDYVARQKGSWSAL